MILLKYPETYKSGLMSLIETNFSVFISSGKSYLELYRLPHFLLEIIVLR